MVGLSTCHKALPHQTGGQVKPRAQRTWRKATWTVSPVRSAGSMGTMQSVHLKFTILSIYLFLSVTEISETRLCSMYIEKQICTFFNNTTTADLILHCVLYVVTDVNHTHPLEGTTTSSPCLVPCSDPLLSTCPSLPTSQRFVHSFSKIDATFPKVFFFTFPLLTCCDFWRYFNICIFTRKKEMSLNAKCIFFVEYQEYEIGCVTSVTWNMLMSLLKRSSVMRYWGNCCFNGAAAISYSCSHLLTKRLEVQLSDRWVSGGFYLKDGGVCLRPIIKFLDWLTDCLPDSRCVAMPFVHKWKWNICDLGAAILVM